MAKASASSKFETKPGSDEFRLSNVDGRATVDVGRPAKFGGKLGPGWRAEKWGGRGWMQVSGHGVKVNRAGQLKTDAKRGEVYECECLRKIKGRNRAERHIVLPGSTEYQIEWDTLADVPDTGYVDLLLEFSGDLTWHKQPALTQEEIDDGAVRPENVVNSYAVYGSRSGRILTPQGIERVNYETGKFCHLFRSCLIDANGNRRWLDQSAPLASPNRLRVHLDTSWLAEASFPVTLDPTFGYTSVGASSATWTSSRQSAHGPFVAPASGTVTHINAYVFVSGSRSMTLGIWADSSGPLGLLRDTAAFTAPLVANWTGDQALDSAASIVSSAIYWLGGACERSLNSKYDAVAGFYQYDKSYTYSAGTLIDFTSPPSVNYTDFKFSIYATYEEASGHPAIKRFGGIPFAALNRGVW